MRDAVPFLCAFALVLGCAGREQPAASANGCEKDLHGKWEVTGHVAPGIAALSSAEADAWIGRVLKLDDDRMEFGDEVCPSPAVETQALSAADFTANYRVTPASLGLEGEPVCVTRIGCGGGSAPAPGSTLIHDEHALLTFWDGVFFRLERR